MNPISNVAPLNNLAQSCKKIYITRHGETEYNRLGIVQGGGVDSSLNAKGMQQAQAFWEAYKHIPFEKVYTSALVRTIQSVKNFIEKPIPHEIFPALNELGWGEKEGRKSTPEEDADYYKMLADWRMGKTHLKIEGGESPEGVAERQKIFLKTLSERNHEKNVLVCMHGRALRIMMCQLLNYPLKKMDDFPHENLCLYELTYTGSFYTIEKFNQKDHLMLVRD